MTQELWMSAILWSVIAVGAAFGVLYAAVRRAQRRLPPLVLVPGETMPATRLQRMARVTFAMTAILTLAAVALVVYRGAEVTWNDDAVRLTATGLLVAGLAVFTIYLARVASWSARDDGTLDERDRAILASAPAGQAPAMIVTLAAWMIGLSEAYHGTHLVPSVFLYMIFWSLLMMSILGLLAGVLLGYRRS